MAEVQLCREVWKRVWRRFGGVQFPPVGVIFRSSLFPESPGVYFLSRTRTVSQLFAFMFCFNRCLFCSELNFDRFEMAMMVHTYWVSKEKVDQEKINSLPTAGNMCFFTNDLYLSWCPVATFRWNNSWRMETCRHRWMIRDGPWWVGRLMVSPMGDFMFFLSLWFIELYNCWY